MKNVSQFKQYLDGGGGVEHVFQAEVAAAVQVVFAEVLYELQVVQSISQTHILLQTNICEGREIHQVSPWRQYEFDDWSCSGCNADSNCLRSVMGCAENNVVSFSGTAEAFKVWSFVNVWPIVTKGTKGTKGINQWLDAT